MAFPNPKKTGKKMPTKGGKKCGYFLVALMAVALCASVGAQDVVKTVTTTTTLEESGQSLILMTSGFTDNKFKSFGGGFKIGGQMTVNEAKDEWVRVIYAQFNVGADPIQALELSALQDYYVGSKWKLYLMLAGTTYIGGDNNGTDFSAGFGLSRRVWTAKDASATHIPFGVDLYGEMIFTEGSGQPSGSFAQINLGIKLNKASKK
jgi:hypothetical protein